MKVTMLDLRRKTGLILKALRNNEKVRLFYRGRETAWILPLHSGKKIKSVDHPFFGSSKKSLKTVPDFMRRLRSPRYAV